MKAITHNRYGPPEVLKYSDVRRPEPRNGEVLVRVEAAALNASDLLAVGGTPIFMRLSYGGLFKPKRPVPGSDIAGVVVECGPDTTSRTPGARVVADLSESGRGGFAEYVTVPQEILVTLPEGVTFESGAAAPTAAVTAYQALKAAADIRPGERVLIDGASGGVGSFAVQIAKTLGAHVTAICGASKAGLARQLGADLVIPREEADSLESSARFDVIYAVNGRRSLKQYMAALSETGRFVMTGGSGSLAGKVMLQPRRLTQRSGRSVVFVSMKPQPAHLVEILDWIERGSIRSVVDVVLPLSETAQGLSVLKAGKARGKILVRPGQ